MFNFILFPYFQKALQYIGTNLAKRKTVIENRGRRQLFPIAAALRCVS